MHQLAFFGKAKEVIVDAMAVNTNPIRRRLAAAFALSINELEGTPLPNSTVKPNPAAEPEIMKYDIICSYKLTTQSFIITILLQIIAKAYCSKFHGLI